MESYHAQLLKDHEWALYALADLTKQGKKPLKYAHMPDRVKDAIFDLMIGAKHPSLKLGTPEYIRLPKNLKGGIEGEYISDRTRNNEPISISLIRHATGTYVAARIRTENGKEEGEKSKKKGLN